MMKIGLIRPTLAGGSERAARIHRKPPQKGPNPDLRGQRFGWVVALYLAKKGPNGDTRWHCRCKCGREFDCDRSALVRGQQKTCGKAGCRGKAGGKKEPKPLANDLAGRRFGRCVAIRPLYRSKVNCHIYWECRCDCGSLFNTQRVGLLHGRTLSCGMNGCRGKSRRWREAGNKSMESMACQISRVRGGVGE